MSKNNAGGIGESICSFCERVRPPSPGDHDPCIVDLPGVMNACCGHGDPKADVYVQFWDKTESGEHRRIKGQAAFAFFKLHGKGPPDVISTPTDK